MISSTQNPTEKQKFHFSEVKGGKIPENNSQAVIDKPESVNRVKPPTPTIDMINIIIINNHKRIHFVYGSIFTNIIYTYNSMFNNQ